MNEVLAGSKVVDGKFSLELPSEVSDEMLTAWYNTTLFMTHDRYYVKANPEELRLTQIEFTTDAGMFSIGTFRECGIPGDVRKGDVTMVYFFYADRNARISGNVMSVFGTSTERDVCLAKGWNMIVVRHNNKGLHYTITYVAEPMPENAIWR